MSASDSPGRFSPWVTEGRQGLLQFGQVLGAEDDGHRASVTRDCDTLLLVLDAADDVAEVVADVANRLNRHVHDVYVYRPFARGQLMPHMGVHRCYRQGRAGRLT